MAKLKKFKARPSSTDVDMMREKTQQLIKNRKEVIDQKFEEKKVYYTNKLTEMVDATLSTIDKETTPQQLADILKIGDKEWKSLCATGRKTNKISVPIDLYMQTMMTNLIQRKILTVSGEQGADGEAKAFVLDDPLKENEEPGNNIPQNEIENNNTEEVVKENDMLSAANSVDTDSIKSDGE
jgi:hypothetical protein